MKQNFPTNQKNDGPEIHVELFRIPKPVISRKELREKEFERNQKRTMDLLRKSPEPDFASEMERLKRMRTIGNRMALIALILAFFNLCFVVAFHVIRMVLK